MLQSTEIIFLEEILCIEKNEAEIEAQKFGTARSFMDLKRRGF